MKRFLVRGAFFTFPLALLLGLPLFVLWGAGELTSPAEVVAMQQEDIPVLYNPAYSNQGKALQLTAILTHKPEVLTLGNSRVSQFRGAFFRDSVSFYNGTMTVTKVSDMRYVLSQIPEGQEPELIIIGLDHWFFNENFWDYDDRTLPERFEPVPSDDIYTRNWKTVYTDYLDGKFDLSVLWTREHAIGLNAKVNSLGHRNDGSTYYGNIVEDTDRPDEPRERFKGALVQINNPKKNDQHSLSYGQDLSQQSLQELRLFLEACDARDIHVIAFLPIYAHTVWEAMRDAGDRYAYQEKLPEALRPMLEEYGFEFYDFSDIRSVGSSDEEALDATHGSAKAHARLMLRILEQGSALERYTNQDHLEHLLQHSDSPLEVL